MGEPEKTETDLHALAAALAAETAKKIAAQPENRAAHQAALIDLNSAATKACLDSEYPGDEDLARLGPALASELPPYDVSALYEKRQNLAALAGMTALGWLLGGFASGLLSLVGLGGDILRAAGVFAMLWLSEYLSASPRARKTVLACLGLSGLARLASSALGGFAGAAGLRQAIFGAGRLPNIFKAAWLIFGAFFVFVFLAKKIDGLNLGAFEASLEKQVLARLGLVSFVFAELSRREAPSAPGGSSFQLAAAVADMLDGLPQEKSAHLRQALRLSGFEIPESGDWIVWDEERDRPLYETVGLVRNGDRCLVLARPLAGQGERRRGRVQRAD